MASRRGVIVEASFEQAYAPRRRRAPTGSIFDGSRDLRRESR